MIHSTMPKPKRKPVPTPGSWGEKFLAGLDQIETDARAAGANMSVVCKKAGISRAGPVRWRNKIPTTIQIMDRMADVTAKLLAKSLQQPKT